MTKFTQSEIPEDTPALFDFELTADDLVTCSDALEFPMRMLQNASDDMEVLQSPGRFTYSVRGHAPIAIVEMALAAIGKATDRKVNVGVPST